MSSDRKQEAGERRPFNPQKPPGRNDPCFCGSGKKFKKCCWAKTRTPTVYQWVQQKAEEGRERRAEAAQRAAAQIAIPGGPALPAPAQAGG